MTRRYVRIHTRHDAFGVGEIYEVRSNGTMANDSSLVWYPIDVDQGYIHKTDATEITSQIKQGVINSKCPGMNWRNREFKPGTGVNVVESLFESDCYDIVIPNIAGYVLTILKSHVNLMSNSESKAPEKVEAKRFIVTSPTEKAHLLAMFESFGYTVDDVPKKVIIPSSLNPLHVILRANGVYYFARTLPVELMVAFPLHTFKVEVKHVYTTTKEPTVVVENMEYPEAWVASLIEQAKEVPAKK